MDLEATAILYGPYSIHRIGNRLNRPINIGLGCGVAQTQA
jgi:hypothetical protein